MVARNLIRELDRRGIRLEDHGGQLVARGPSEAITPEVKSLIQAQKDALLRELQSGLERRLTPLPEPLVRLISAAHGRGLNRPSLLPSGLVSDLGAYVLSCAALYAAGIDPEEQLRDLWEARGAWAM